MTTTLVVCPTCGAENTGTRFCESCGAPAPVVANVVPTAVGAPPLATPSGAARLDRGLLRDAAVRALAVGPVAIVLLPSLAGSILALSGGLPGYYYDEWFTGAGTYLFLAALALVWPLTLILAALTAAAGVFAALTSDRPPAVKAGVIALVVAGCVLLSFWSGAWVPGGVAFAVAWILLTRLRGWSYYSLFVPVVTGVVSVFAIRGADAHILVAAVLLGVLAAGTVVGVLLLGRDLDRRQAARPPKPPPAPRPAPYAAGAVPGPVVAGPMVMGQVVTGQPMPPGAVIVPGYPGGYTPGYLVAPRRTNGFAIASFVLGLLTGTVLAVVFGHVALSQIRRSGEGGRGLAIAGLVLGYLWTSVVVAYLIFVIAVAVNAANAYNSFYY